VSGRRGRRSRELLDDLKERRRYSHLKEKASDRTTRTARFGRGFGYVVRQASKRKVIQKIKWFQMNYSGNAHYPLWVTCFHFILISG
jgi:hypothetical protein